MINKIKMHLMIFFLFLSHFSADRSSRVLLFPHFYPKIDSNAYYFDSVFSNIGRYNRKMINAVRFFVIKIRISVIFTSLWSKLTSKTGQKVGRLDWKTEQNCLKVPSLTPFLQKSAIFLEKRKTLVDFSL